jgi:hypothetical protein
MGAATDNSDPNSVVGVLEREMIGGKLAAYQCNLNCIYETEIQLDTVTS